MVFMLFWKVDGDTSTNDTIIALASGVSGSKKISSLSNHESHQLQACLDAVSFIIYSFVFSVLKVLVQFLSNALLEKQYNKPSPLMCFMVEYIRSNILFLTNVTSKIHIIFLFELTCVYAHVFMYYLASLV